MSEEEHYSPGQRIGDYTVLEELGRGGMGVVYLTQHYYLKKRFAVKVMPKQFSERPEFANLFQQEAQTLGTLHHPNIVEVHNFGMHEGSQYLVMDYIEGGTIEDYLKKSGGQMQPDEVCATMHAVMTGLQHAHNNSIIHRDLKPENFLLDMDGTIKITDFGLAQLMDAELDADGNIVGRAERPSATMVELYADQLKNQQFTGGTEGYMAPEVISGAAGDKRADYYAIGVIAYYLLTGQLPKGNYKPATTLVKKLDKRWDVFLGRCLEDKPEDRYQSPEEILTELDLLSKKPRSRAIIAGVLTVATMCALGAAIMFKYQFADGSPQLMEQDKPELESAPVQTPPAEAVATEADSKPEPAEDPTPAEKVSEPPTQATAPTRRSPLKNPGFESGLRGWDAQGVGEASVIKDAFQAKEGTQMARLMTFRQSGDTLIIAPFKANWGERIRASVWTRVEGQNPRAQPSATLRLVARGDEQTGIIGYKDVNTSSASEWTELKLDITIPTQAQWPNFSKPWSKLQQVELHLVMECKNPGLARVWFDAIELEVLTPEDPDYEPAPEAAANKRPSDDDNGELVLPEESETQEAEFVAPKPKAKPRPEDAPLSEDMAQLTLTVLDALGKELPPEAYTLSLNGKAFDPLPNTNVYRFEANRQIRISITAASHREETYPSVHVKGGAKETFTSQLEPLE